MGAAAVMTPDGIPEVQDKDADRIHSYKRIWFRQVDERPNPTDAGVDSRRWGCDCGVECGAETPHGETDIRPHEVVIGGTTKRL
ncbi:hypothetical protein PG984_015059 [Apiospora sp. TS-2023a]